MELTILMPCLNEAETLGRCIDKARAFLERAGVDGEVLVADNGSTRRVAGASPPRGARGSSRSPSAATGPRCGAVSRPRAAATSSWAMRTTATISRDLGGFLAALRGGRRPRHGQPLPRRHPAGGHARAAPAPRQPGAELHRPAVLQDPGARFPLRPARLPHGCHPRARAAHRGHGVRQRDGGARRARAAEGGRGAHDPRAGRPLAAAAPADLARRLAAPQVPADLLPALALPLSRGRFPVGGHWRWSRCSSPGPCGSAAWGSRPRRSWPGACACWWGCRASPSH